MNGTSTLAAHPAADAARQGRAGSRSGPRVGARWREAGLAGLLAVLPLLGAVGLVLAGLSVGAVFAGAALLAAGAAALAAGRTARRRAVALRAVREALRRVEGGDLDARVELPARAGREAAELAASLNGVLDAMTGDRRRLRDVAARAFRAQESERLRVARELQEETAQTLAGLLFHLGAARAAADPRARDAILDQIRSGLAQTTDTVRHFARGLYPPALEDLGVVAAVEAYALALRDASGIPVLVRAAEVRGLLARDGEIALYRIVQEALSNAVRHAAPRSVRVEVARLEGRVRVTVEDDGRGFVLAEREAHDPCLGLFGMRERAAYAGGSVAVESQPGRGTRVRVELPVTTEAAGGAGWPPIVARPLGPAVESVTSAELPRLAGPHPALQDSATLSRKWEKIG